MSLNIATIVAKNYLSHARTLVDSFLEHHPDGRAFVLLADRVDGYFDPQVERFTLLEIERLKEIVPEFKSFTFQYTILELSTAIKPFFLQYLFQNYPIEKLIYFDPDILVTANLAPVEELLDSYSIIITPHLTSPIEDSFRPSEIDILLAGTYNLGFVALRKDEMSNRFLDWWKRRLVKYCIIDIARGYHVDQKWVDLVPWYFPGVNVLREPGYNVSYWNLHERRITNSQEGLKCNGKPLYFFHFSGFSPDHPHEISKHQDRYKMSDLGFTQKLFDKYRELLYKNGFERENSWPYAFSKFDNNVNIPDLARRLFLKLGDKAKYYGDPFNVVSSNSYFNWLTTAQEHGLSPLLMEMYNSRPDLIRTFPDVTGRDKYNYLIWALSDGIKQYKLDHALLTNIFLNIRNKRNVARAIAYGKIKDKMKTFYNLLKGFRILRPVLLNLNSMIKEVLKNITRKKAGNVKEDMLSPHKTTSLLFGVNIAGYIQSEKGMGEAVRSDIRCLELVGIPHVLININDPFSSNIVSEYGNFSYDNPFLINLIHVNADQVPIFLQDKQETFFQDRINIGNWTWELSSFPQEWQGSFSPFREIWVPSNFVLDAVSRCSPIPVVRIPLSIHLVDEFLKPKLHRDKFSLPAQSFIFFFMFDFYSYKARKNPEGLIDSFKMAFSPQEKALLLLKCNHSEAFPTELAELKDLSVGHQIIILEDTFTREELISLISLTDCYVSLHRSEGFGLTLAEAMALGKPVIATGYSGNMDFMNSSNSYLVKYRLIEIDRDYGPYKRGFLWADPDIDDAVRLLRYVYEHHEDALHVGQVAAKDIQCHFAPSVIARMYEERLKHISYYSDRGFKLSGRI